MQLMILILILRIQQEEQEVIHNKKSMKVNVKVIVLITIIFFMCSCKGKGLTKEKDGHIGNEQIEKDEEYLSMSKEKEFELIAEALKKQGYKNISNEDFIKRSIRYFGNQIEEDEGKDFLSNITDEGYSISTKFQVLNTAILPLTYDGETLGPDYTEEQVVRNLGNTNRFITKQIMAYNKLLFNDDKLAIYFFIDKMYKDNAIEVVVNFGYENNDELVDYVISFLNPSSINFECMFLYNDTHTVRRDFLKRFINKRGSMDMYDFLLYFIEKWDKTNDVLIDQKIEAIIYILNNLERNKESMAEDVCYNFIDNINTTDKLWLLEKIERNANCNQEVKVIIKKYREIGGNYPLEKRIVGFIKDIDGYTNLRKSFTSKSEIIKELKNGTKVFILKMEGKRWLIETEDGVKGYVFYDRVVWK